MRRYLFFLMFGLGACAPPQSVIASTDSWTGFAQIVTPEREIFRDAKAIMTVRPVSIARNGERAFGVLTNVRRRVPNGPIINSMYSGNVRLDYQRHDRLLTHCIDGCQRAEIGVINLTEAGFRIAARTGLPLRVFGRRGRYAGTVPAQQFQQVLDAISKTRHE